MALLHGDTSVPVERGEMASTTPTEPASRGEETVKYDPAEHHEPLLEVPQQRSETEARQSKKSAPSVARGKCPECAAKATIGIIRQGEHLVWRLHHKVTYAGARMECGASGAALCTATPIDIPGVTTPACVCKAAA